ncbi:MSMEG_1061 family FMN-dependent PPOX-type flavoprotein [Streptomyces sp. NPDC057702]|uniref:MSMEG_1061 family FMN-dependent PPOX-type flavoprotein n=1 Tax=unclassified Streptomyces TaxID=2593676 RepID=UPI0036BB330D
MPHRTDATATEHRTPSSNEPGPAMTTRRAGGAGGRPGHVALPAHAHAELRELLGEPHPIVIDKVHARLDEDDLAFVARSPFCLLSTADAHGACDASPRGGAPGFTHVLDPGTLVLPERPGNRRGDSLHNILDNPHAGLLYLLPGSRDILRVNGRARVLTDAPCFDALTTDGQRPRLAVQIDIVEVYRHCPQSLNRSALWTNPPQSIPHP